MFLKLPQLQDGINPDHIATIKKIRDGLANIPKMKFGRRKYREYYLLKTPPNSANHTELFSSML